jgi:hypothetical protein
MWILSHMGLVGNELVDERARQTVLEGSIFNRPLSSSQSLARPALIGAWQAKWNSADNGRFAHSIFTDVTMQPWFEEISFVCTVSRVLSEHCSVRSHRG